jgi:hypothetical protein
LPPFFKIEEMYNSNCVSIEYGFFETEFQAPSPNHFS